MAPRKPKVPKSEVDSAIERYLKKNRIFGKVDKIKLEDINLIEMIVTKLLDFNENDVIKHIIIQYGILEDHFERFLYTDDCYVICLTNIDVFNEVCNLDMTPYNNLNIIKLYNGELTNLTHKEE